MTKNAPQRFGLIKPLANVTHFNAPEHAHSGKKTTILEMVKILFLNKCMGIIGLFTFNSIIMNIYCAILMESWF